MLVIAGGIVLAWLVISALGAALAGETEQEQGCGCLIVLLVAAGVALALGLR